MNPELIRIVDGIARDVEDAPHHTIADRHGDGLSGVGDRDAALQALGSGHRNRAHPAVTKMLLDFERQRDRLIQDGVVDLERAVD